MPQTRDLFESYLDSKGINYRSDDSAVRFDDPFKAPDVMSMSYYLESGKCIGYRSGFKGNVHQVIAKIEHCDLDRARTIFGAGISSSNAGNYTKPKVAQDPEFQVMLPAYCTSLLFDAETDTYKRAIEYLIDERGFEYKDILDYNLHYCWGGKYDERIIIPYFENRKFVFWQGRTFDADNSFRYAFPKKKDVGVGSGDFIFNIDNQSETLILCEGPLDAITIGGAALGGKSLTKNQLIKVIKKGFSKVILAIDNDESGFEMLDKVANQLNPFGIKIMYAIPKGGKDWNKIGREASMNIISNPKNYSLKTKYLKKY